MRDLNRQGLSIADGDPLGQPRIQFGDHDPAAWRHRDRLAGIGGARNDGASVVGDGKRRGFGVPQTIGDAHRDGSVRGRGNTDQWRLAASAPADWTSGLDDNSRFANVVMVPIGTVMSRLARARGRLTATLAQSRE